MLKTSTYLLNACSKYVLVCSIACCFPQLTKADLGISIVTTQNGDQVTADFLVYNFDDIVSMQYTMEWDTAGVSFESVGSFNLPSLSAANFGTNNVGVGKLSFSWIDFNVTGVSLSNCTAIYRVNFISPNGQVPTITINGSQTSIEIINVLSEVVELEQGFDCSNLAQISGKIFEDTDGDCQYGTGEAGLSGWTVKFLKNGSIFLTSVNAAGEYAYSCLPGDYQVSAIAPPNSAWLLSCQPWVFTVSVFGSQDEVQNFGAVLPSATSASFEHGFDAQILPNPVGVGQPIKLKTTTATPRKLMLEIFDANGSLLQATEQEIQTGDSLFEITPVLRSGLFLLNITDGQGRVASLKLVVL